MAGEGAISQPCLTAGDKLQGSDKSVADRNVALTLDVRFAPLSRRSGLRVLCPKADLVMVGLGAPKTEVGLAMPAKRQADTTSRSCPTLTSPMRGNLNRPIKEEIYAVCRGTLRRLLTQWAATARAAGYGSAGNGGIRHWRAHRKRRNL